MPTTKDRDGFEVVSATAECEKLATIQPLSQAVGEFLEWLQGEGIQLCNIPEEYEHTWWPVHRSIQSLLADFFEIDLAKLETERRRILDQLRAAQS